MNLLTTRIGGAIVKSSFCRLRIATPSTSPDAEHTNRRPQVTVRLFSRHTPWLLIRVTIRQRITQSRRMACGPRSQHEIRPLDDFSRESSRCHGHAPVSCRCARSRTQCCPTTAERVRVPASTFNMGRRIMAERRRSRRARRRRDVRRARTDLNTQIDTQADDQLRAFVRVLARQAGREVFEAQLKRGSGPVHRG